MDTDRRLEPADQTAPRISADEAREIAGAILVEGLRSNGVPDQDPSVAHGLIRRRLIDPARPPASVWIVAFRWIAGFDCPSDSGGPGPCPTASYVVIDDRSGEVITAVILTS